MAQFLCCTRLCFREENELNELNFQNDKEQQTLPAAKSKQTGSRTIQQENTENENITINDDDINDILRIRGKKNNIPEVCNVVQSKSPSIPNEDTKEEEKKENLTVESNKKLGEIRSSFLSIEVKGELELSIEGGNKRKESNIKDTPGTNRIKGITISKQDKFILGKSKKCDQLINSNITNTFTEQVISEQNNLTGNIFHRESIINKEEGVSNNSVCQIKPNEADSELVEHSHTFIHDYEVSDKHFHENENDSNEYVTDDQAADYSSSSRRKSQLKDMIPLKFQKRNNNEQRRQTLRKIEEILGDNSHPSQKKNVSNQLQDNKQRKPASFELKKETGLANKKKIPQRGKQGTDKIYTSDAKKNLDYLNKIETSVLTKVEDSSNPNKIIKYPNIFQNINEGKKRGSIPTNYSKFDDINYPIVKNQSSKSLNTSKDKPKDTSKVIKTEESIDNKAKPKPSMMKKAKSKVNC